MSEQRGAADDSGSEPSRPTGKRAARRTRSTDESPSPTTGGSNTTGTTGGSGTTEAKSVATASRAPGRVRAEAAPKANIFTRLRKFFREVVAELRKVIWPNRKQMVTYTAVVLVFVTFMVAYISGLDLAFIRGVQWLFG